MPRIIYRHEPATRFIVSAIGQPGEREFFIQVKSTSGINTLAIDKNQVIALTQRLEELVRELRRAKMASSDELSAKPVLDDQPLELPIEQDFQIGVISITWETNRVIVNIQAASQDDELILDDLESGPDLVVASLNIAQVKGFCERAKVVVSAGRPTCPFCALPVDPNGHLCPRANGYRR
ncbi:MAG: hypothetical protein RIR93_510 [Actinomycetota bacterium]